jgi:hypothetical protein
MIPHIDVAETDFQHGCLNRVARVSLNGSGRYDLVTGDAARWSRVLELGEPPEFKGEADALHFLEAIASRVRGDYLHAFDPHDDAACPFSGGESIPMKAASQAAAPARQIATA